ncbi:MAG: hypothetical protein ACR2MX_15635 [Cyclobacteriaceae bacterium]
MEWYIPITILPGVAMLILSTTSQMMSLSGEIGGLLSQKCTPFEHHISALKIHQLGRLTRSATLLYISAACFVLSGILKGVSINFSLMAIPNMVLYIGVILLMAALALLIIYGFHTIKIRKAQHEQNPNLE